MTGLLKQLANNDESLLDREVWPAASRYVRWARTPLGCLTLAMVASGLCGTFLHPQGFVVMLGLIGVTAIGLVWPWLSLIGLGGSLEFSESRCREGDRTKVRLALRNRALWGSWGVAVKAGLDDSGGEGLVESVMSCLAYVPGNRSSMIDVEFAPMVRGVYPLGKPRLTCGFPFGLTESSRSLRVDEPLLVWPRTLSVSPLLEAVEGHSTVGVAVRDRAGNWGDLLGVRPYRRGDSIRRVHWGQTARQGELIVCEVQSNSVPCVQIILDTHHTSHIGTGSQGSREWSIRVAASLAEGWIGEGAEVRLLLESGSVEATGRTAKTRTTMVLDALARLQAGDGHELSSLLDLPESRHGRSRLRVVITTDVGLKRLYDLSKSVQADRYVVLSSRGFDGTVREGDSSFPQVAPWIWIDSPREVASALLGAGKGAIRERSK